jgi:hypothetical protein
MNAFQSPVRVCGWNLPDISKNYPGQQVFGKSGDVPLKKSLSALSLALSEYSDTDSSVFSSEDHSTYSKKSYKEALESVDERSDHATSDPVTIPFRTRKYRRG